MSYCYGVNLLPFELHGPNGCFGVTLRVSGIVPCLMQTECFHCGLDIALVEQGPKA